MYHEPDHPPWPQVRSTATCYEDHGAPAASCRCGIYAAVEGTLDSLPGYLFDTAYERDPWAYAEISCTGRVFVDMRGVRAQYAEIIRIALPDDVLQDQEAWEAAAQSLGQRYGVPITGIELVPSWVRNNHREQGPPSDAIDLSLDLDKLDLWR